MRGHTCPAATLRHRAERTELWDRQGRVREVENGTWRRNLNWESAGIGRQRPGGRVRIWCPKRNYRRGSLGRAILWCWGCNKRPEIRSFCMEMLGVQETVKKQQKTGSLSAHSSFFK